MARSILVGIITVAAACGETRSRPVAASQPPAPSVATTATPVEPTPPPACPADRLAKVEERTSQIMADLARVAPGVLVATSESRTVSAHTAVMADPTGDTYLVICADEPATLVSGTAAKAPPPWLSALASGECVKLTAAFGPTATDIAYAASGCVHELVLVKPIPALVKATQARERAEAAAAMLAEWRNVCGAELTNACVKRKNCRMTIHEVCAGGKRPEPDQPQPRPSCACECSAAAIPSPRPCPPMP